MNRETNQTGRQLTPEERELRTRRLKRKRNIRIAIVAVGFVILLSLIVCPIVIFAAFRVNSFKVEGVAPYTEAEVIAASGIEEGKSLVFANPEKAAAAIEKNLPYTDNVKITKKLPGGIIIRLEKTEKEYAIQLANGTYALLNSKMKVLEYSSDAPKGVSLIKGAMPAYYETGEILSFNSEPVTAKKGGEPVDRTLSLITEITAAIAENGMKNIDLIDISSSSNIYMIYQNRIVLNLGDSSGIPSKISLGQHTLEAENAISPTQSGTINLTVAGKAYAGSSDPDDIKELVIFNGGEWEEEEPEVTETEEETTESED